MLIRFSVSNFLSFDGNQELSLEAGKARKFSDRLYVNRRLKVVKCEALFGANASGKSNLIDAIRFVKDTVEDGFPGGFSNKYYRLKEENRLKPSIFELELICNEKRFIYGFSAVLNSGCIEEEWLYELTASGIKKCLFLRNVNTQEFYVGESFKGKETIAKLKNYGKRKNVP